MPNKEEKALDIQIGGSHYKSMAIQPIEFAMKNNLNACQTKVIKYITRYKTKNGREDLEKAKHMIDLLIQFEYGEEKSVEESNQINKTLNYINKHFDDSCVHSLVFIGTDRDEPIFTCQKCGKTLYANEMRGSK